MAKVNMEKHYPQIGRPVGSVGEVKALGIETLRNIATCSAHQDRENLGCPMWQFCDREFRGTRPQNQVYRIVKGDGATRVTHGPCFDVVKLEIQTEANGGIVKVVGEEGAKYLSRGSVKLHPKRNPDCNDCSAGKCEKYEDKEDMEFTCVPFPKAADHPELIRFTRMSGARLESRRRSRRSLEAQLLGDPDDGDNGGSGEGGGDMPPEVETSEGKHGEKRPGRS